MRARVNDAAQQICDWYVVGVGRHPRPFSRHELLELEDRQRLVIGDLGHPDVRERVPCITLNFTQPLQFMEMRWPDLRHVLAEGARQLRRADPQRIWFVAKGVRLESRVRVPFWGE
jgi:hypothetical protein